MMNMMLDRSLLLRVSSVILLVILFQAIVAHWRVERETKRRLQHALTGHALVQISYMLPLQVSIAVLLIAAFLMAGSKVLAHEWFMETFGPLLRPEELRAGTLPGAFYFLVGTAITASLVDLSIARYAVECLAMADPMASLVGSTIPSPQLFKGSSLSGCTACFGTAYLVGVVMLLNWSNNDDNHDDTAYSQLTLLLGALACTIAEAIPIGNDNLNIPIVTALVVNMLGK
jgi:dolichol kinase